MDAEDMESDTEPVVLKKDEFVSNSPGKVQEDIKLHMEPVVLKEEFLSKRPRKLFTNSENRLVDIHLHKFIKNKDMKLDKDEIWKYLSGIPEMATLLEERGVHKLIVKIRTERKR